MTATTDSDDDRPEFDPAFAQALIGKHILIGITYYRRLDRSFLRREQFHGRVTDADAAKGIRLELGGKHAGVVKWLPPQTDVFKPAPPGDYNLHDAQETVQNPDYLATWNVFSPDA